MVNSVAHADPAILGKSPLPLITDKLNMDYYKIFVFFSKLSRAFRNSVFFLCTMVLIVIEIPSFLSYAIILTLLNIVFSFYLIRYQTQVVKEFKSFSRLVGDSAERVYEGIELNSSTANPDTFITDQEENFEAYSIYRMTERMAFHINSVITQIPTIFLVWFIAF